MDLRARFPHLAGDLRGAFASMLVGLPYSVTAGMLAFAPLGPNYVASGMVAGLASSAVAGIVSALAGGTPCQINGPRGSVAVLMAGLITAIAVHPALNTGQPPSVPRILGIALLCTALAGLLQVAFGLLRFGAGIRFLPYPVVSGFMVALGLLVMWPQLPPLLGLDTPLRWDELLRGAGLHWGAMVVGLATVAVIVSCRKAFARAPAPLVGMLAGTAVHYLLLALFGREAVGLTGLDSLTNGQYPPRPWDLPALSIDRPTLEVVFAVLPAVVTIAFIGSMESLLSSSVLSIATQTHFRSHRELIAQGLSNMAVAAAGGAVSCGAPFRGIANYQAGGRTRLSGTLHAVLAMPLLLFALPLLLVVPIAVFAGVLLVVGWDVVTAWRRRLMTCPKADIAVGVLVGGVTLWLGTVPAVLLGVVGAMLLYVRNTSRAPLRGHYDGAARPSARIRTEEQALHLRSLGPAIRVIEAQGSLFFGTAHRFGRAVEAIAAGCRHVILDLQRVHEVDASGALVLTQTMRRLGEQGIRAAIAAVAVDDRRGTVMVGAGLDKVVPRQCWFEDADRALEQAEDFELKARWPDLEAGAELPLSAMDICRGMSAAEVAGLEPFLQRLVVPAGAALFHEGDPGGRLYLLARGAITVSVKLADGAERSRRLGTFSPGVMLGEMAAIEGTARSADAFAASACVLYALDGGTLERMRAQAPDLYGRFMLNMARHLAGRLRHVTLALREASS